MTDNFDMKKFLVENKLGSYSKLKKEGEAAYEYEKGKAAGEKEEKEKLAKEDIGGDIGDAEAMKQMDFLAEESNPAFIKWLSDFKEEYSDKDEVNKEEKNPLIINLEKYGLDKATTPKEFYDIVEKNGEKYNKYYRIGDKSNILSVSSPKSYEDKQLYFITLGPGMSAYAYWIGDDNNKVIPKGKDNSKNIYPPGSRMDENFNLVQAFKSSPSKASYSDVESIIDSIDSPKILDAFKEMFNGKESISKQEYIAFLKNYPSDLSPDEVMAYWESLFDKDTFAKAGLAERKKKIEEMSNPLLPQVEKVISSLETLHSNTSTNSQIPTTSKEGLLRAFDELMEMLDTIAFNLEVDDEYVSDYSRRRASELNEVAHKEGDALVTRFIKGIAKKYDYSEKDAVDFIKERLKHLGY